MCKESHWGFHLFSSMPDPYLRGGSTIDNNEVLSCTTKIACGFLIILYYALYGMDFKGKPK